MKWIFITICLVIQGTCWCLEDDEDKLQILFDDNTTISTPQEAIGAVKTIIHSKCEEVGGKTAVTNLENAVDDLIKCVDALVPDDIESIKNSTDDLCLDRHKIRGCFNGVIKALEDCSNEDEKYVPEFIFSAIDGLFDFACSNQFDLDEVLTPTTNTTGCIEHLKRQDDVKKVCNDEIKHLTRSTNPQNIKMTKAELCSDLKAVKECVGDYLGKECPNDTILKKLVTGLITAISKSCAVNKISTLL